MVSSDDSPEKKYFHIGLRSYIYRDHQGVIYSTNKERPDLIFLEAFYYTWKCEDAEGFFFASENIQNCKKELVYSMTASESQIRSASYQRVTPVGFEGPSICLGFNVGPFLSFSLFCVKSFSR
jgi:hypothetical protein